MNKQSTILNKALVISYSNIVRDPRVRRQVEWLQSAGWDVSTLGLGSESVSDTEHFQIQPSIMPRVLRAFWLLTLPKKRRFSVFVSKQIPKSLHHKLQSFQAIVVNEIDLLPWVEEVIREFPNLKIRHLDLHEYHQFEAPLGIPKILVKRLQQSHNWMYSLIGTIKFTSYSTVAPGIAELYKAEFGINDFQMVYNSRPYYELSPSEVNEHCIELLYHGNAQADRGLSLLLDAATKFQPRFRLNLMLTGDQNEILRLKEYSEVLGLNLHWLDPVAMEEVPNSINKFDIEIIFYPPKTPNLLYSFPNKFFEAIQGRLAVVVGESPSMLAEITRYKIGFVVHGWKPEDLSKKVNSLSTEDIRHAKFRTNQAAQMLVTSNDKGTFLRNFA